MKYCLFVFGLMIVCAPMFGQNWQKEVGDKWFNETDGGPKVGEKMPDIPLGTVTNNYTGKTKFSDFKGKLVILDFWTTHCPSCIASFPKMDKLQKEFGDRIQIFLVNPYETQQEIDHNLGLGFNKKYKLPDLPSIVDAKYMQHFFPLRGVPHHVWINQEGVVCLRGASFNTNEEKIRDFLMEKDISFLKDLNVTPYFDRKKPYYNVVGRLNNDRLSFMGSFFTKHSNDYSPMDVEKLVDIVDSGAGTIRDTYINNDIVELYSTVFWKEIIRNEENVITNRVATRVSHYVPSWMDYVLLEVKDTSQITSFFLPFADKTDRNFIKSKFCYEQVDVVNMGKEERRKYMLENLNRYFGSLYGIEGRLEKRKTNCQVLVRTSVNNQLRTKGGKLKVEEFTEKGKLKVRYTNSSSLIGACKEGARTISLPGNKTLFILDETGLRDIDIVLPKVFGSLEELKSVLGSYGLDIVPAEREIEFMLIREKDIAK